jgi:hypothetical protein
MMPSAGADPALNPPTHRALSVTIAGVDEMRLVTYLAVAGMITAVVLRLIGGVPFDLPMPTHAIGWVEPSCGLTRGSLAIVRGDFALGFRYNPLAFLVIGFGISGVVRAIVGWTTGRWLNVRVRVSRAGLVVLAFGILAFWLYQQTKADFIINSRS